MTQDIVLFFLTATLDGAQDARTFSAGTRRSGPQMG